MNPGAPGDVDDAVDCFCDEVVRHLRRGLANQLFEPGESAQGRVGMQGGDAARMAGIPGLQHVERLGAAHFTDNDPVWPEAQGRADKVCKSY